jgi:hypothetical protein
LFNIFSRTPNDEKCGTRNLQAHTLGVEPTAARSTPLHAAENDAFAAGALLSKEKAERKAAAVAQAAALESAGTPLDTGPDGHRTMRK